MGLLKKMIVKHKSSVKKAGEVYYNKRGAIYEGGESSTDDNDIYIECHPTGSEGETNVQIPKSITGGKDSDSSLNFKNPVVIVIIGLLAGLVLIFIISTVMSFFRTRNNLGASSSSLSDVGNLQT